MFCLNIVIKKPRSKKSWMAFVGGLIRSKIVESGLPVSQHILRDKRGRSCGISENTRFGKMWKEPKLLSGGWSSQGSVVGNCFLLLYPLLCFQLHQDPFKFEVAGLSDESEFRDFFISLSRPTIILSIFSQKKLLDCFCLCKPLLNLLIGFADVFGELPWIISLKSNHSAHFLKLLHCFPEIINVILNRFCKTFCNLLISALFHGFVRIRILS